MSEQDGQQRGEQDHDRGKDNELHDLCLLTHIYGAPALSVHAPGKS